MQQYFLLSQTSIWNMLTIFHIPTHASPVRSSAGKEARLHINILQLQLYYLSLLSLSAHTKFAKDYPKV